MIFDKLKNQFNSRPSQKAVDAFCRHAKEGNIPAVKKFLDKYKDAANAKDKKGSTALVNAALKGHIECVSLLLERGADVNLSSVNEITTVECAARWYPDMMELLLKHSADPNQRDNYGETVLMLAAKYGREDNVALLLKAGARVDETVRNGATALICAAEHGREDSIKLLLDAGAEINQRDYTLE